MSRYLITESEVFEIKEAVKQLDQITSILDAVHAASDTDYLIDYQPALVLASEMAGRLWAKMKNLHDEKLIKCKEVQTA